MDDLIGGLVEVNGHTVEYDALRIAERVNEYDPNLRVQVLMDEFVTVDQPPFQVVETCRDGKDRVVFSAWQLDNRILERIMAADTRIIDVNERSIESNRKVRQSNKQRYQEKIEEGGEIAKAILATHKDTYTATIDGEKKVFKA